MKINQIVISILYVFSLTVYSMKNIKVEPEKLKFTKYGRFSSNYFNNSIISKNSFKHLSLKNNTLHPTSTLYNFQKNGRNTFIPFFSFNNKAAYIPKTEKTTYATSFAQLKVKKEQEKQEKNSQSYWKKFLALIGITLGGTSLATMEENTQKKNSHWRTINKESLNALYEWGNSFKSLFIPQEQLNYSSDGVVYLKELFNKNNIDPNYNAMGARTQKSQNDWEHTETVFKKRAEKGTTILNDYNIAYVTLDKSQILLQDAKTLLKSFLLSNTTDYPIEKGIEKFNLQRLFTYAKLEQIIEENNLTHIHLPKKNLIIKDKKTGKLITGKEASQIVDEVVKIALCGYGAPFNVFIDGWSDKYELKILAERITPHKPGLNEQAYNELKILVTQAPFDIGHDNIFTDNEGNAVIIDTEFKGEPAEDCIPKLKRYMYKKDQI